MEKKEFAASVGPLEKAFSLDPGLAQAGLDLSEALIEGERFEEALAAVARVKEVLAAAPVGAQAEDLRTRARLFYLEGRSLKELGRLEEAREAFERSVAAHPRNAATRALLGNVLSLLKKPEEALKHLEEALRGMESLGVWNGREQVHYQIALCLKALGRTEEARRHFHAHQVIQERIVLLNRLEIAAGYHPESPAAHLELGYARYRYGLLPQAAQSFEEAVRLAPGDARALAALAVSYLRQERLAEGAELARRSLEKETTPSGYYALALSRQFQKDSRQAEEALLRAEELLGQSEDPLRDEIQELAAQLRAPATR